MITAVEIITTEVKKIDKRNLYDGKYIKVNDGHENESSTRYDGLYIERLTINTIQTQDKYIKYSSICVLSLNTIVISSFPFFSVYAFRDNFCETNEQFYDRTKW